MLHLVYLWIFLYIIGYSCILLFTFVYHWILFEHFISLDILITLEHFISLDTLAYFFGYSCIPLNTCISLDTVCKLLYTLHVRASTYTLSLDTIVYYWILLYTFGYSCILSMCRNTKRISLVSPSLTLIQNRPFMSSGALKALLRSRENATLLC